MPEYSLATIAAVVLVVAVELLWARTGIFATRQYWFTMLIVFAFQVLVDGWLTRLPDPIVSYHPDQFSGVRFPLDIPIEDFGFGFALVTAVIIGWRVGARRESRLNGKGTVPVPRRRTARREVGTVSTPPAREPGTGAEPVDRSRR